MKREIEKKYLINDIKAQHQLVKDLKNRFPKLQHKGKKVISSCYYELATPEQVLSAGRQLLTKTQLKELEQVVKKSDNLSIRCRSIDDTQYLVVKGSKAGDDPVHAADRLEFEVVIDKDLEEINKVILGTGVKLVSKFWSERDFYDLDGNMKADVEFCSGYGHKAELELVINDGESVDQAIAELDQLADELGLYYASDELMGKMYQYYCDHWEDFWGTDKVFSDEVWAQLGRSFN